MVDVEQVRFQKQTAIWIAFRGTDVDPEEIGRRLNLVPTEWKHRRGDEVQRGGQTLSEPDGFCAFTSHAGVPRDEDFESHAGWLLDRLEPHAALIASWQAAGWNVRLTITTVTNARSDGPLVSPNTLLRLAHLGVPTLWKTAHIPEHAGLNGADPMVPGGDGGVTSATPKTSP